MTPGEVGACIAVISRSGRFLRGDQESLRRPEHLFVQPEVLGVAFGSLLNPIALQTSGRAIRHTLRQPGGLPFSSPPRRARFLGVLLGWFAHSLNHNSSDLRMQEIRISRNTVIWIIKRKWYAAIFVRTWWARAPEVCGPSLPYGDRSPARTSNPARVPRGAESRSAR